MARRRFHFRLSTLRVAWRRFGRAEGEIELRACRRGLARIVAMDENPYQAPVESGSPPKHRAPFMFGKRAPGDHPFEFFGPGWFIAGVLFLPLMVLLFWLLKFLGLV